MDKLVTNCDNIPEPWLIEELERLKEEARRKEEESRPRVYIEPPSPLPPPGEEERESIGPIVIELCPRSLTHSIWIPTSTST